MGERGRQRQKEGEMEREGGREGEGKHEAFRAVSSVLKLVLMAEHLNIIYNLHNNVKIAKKQQQNPPLSSTISNFNGF